MYTKTNKQNKQQKTNEKQSVYLSVAVFECGVHEFGVEGIVVTVGDGVSGLQDLVEQHEGLYPRGDGAHVDDLEQTVQLVLK